MFENILLQILGCVIFIMGFKAILTVLLFLRSVPKPIPLKSII